MTVQRYNKAEVIGAFCSTARDHLPAGVTLDWCARLPGPERANTAR